MPESRYVRTLLVAFAMFMVAACGGGPRPLVLNVVGTPDLNSTDAETSGNAVVVQIFELTNETNFRDVTLETFWRGNVEALGAELVNSRQLLLYPNTNQTVEITPEEQTQFIGVAADFRQPDREQWRRLYPVEELRGQSVTVEIGKNKITFEVR